MTAVTIYNAPRDLSRSLAVINTTMDSLTSDLKSTSRYPTTAKEMLDDEEQQRTTGRRISDLSIARNIIRAHMDVQLRREASEEVRRRYREQGVNRPIKNKGWTEVTILLPGGLRLKMKTPYLRPSRNGLPGRPRGTGKRREGGAGCYPVLERLGIECEATPLTRSMVSRQTVLCSSYAEAQEQLKREGLDLDVSQMVALTTYTGEVALKLRNEELLEALEAPLPEESMFAGKRIRVSIDGGRARTRVTFRTSKKGKNGRRPFVLEWREPRVITIDVLDETGEMDRRWRPIYEVSTGDADQVFELFSGLLRLVGAHLASQIVFVSDGAKWIWERTDKLFERAGISPDQVEFILDFYHATEHISDALKAYKSLKPQQRTAYLRIFSKELLEPDGPAKVIQKLRAFSRGRRAKEMNKHINYLVRHLEAGRLRYHELRQAKVPIGSGVVESAIRRVVNLRFKSASQCWNVERMEALMYLRAILKSGRWDDAMAAQLDLRYFLKTAQPDAVDNGVLENAA